MKFLKHHREKIKEAIQDAGFEKTDFTFIKRKGRILCSHIASKEYFSYFENRAKPHLSKFMPLEYKSYYEIRWSDQDKRKVAKWDEVIQEFGLWLRALKNKDHMQER